MKVIIPARLDSQRLKHKMLLPFGDVPLLVATWQNAVNAFGSSDVFIASGDSEISDMAEAYGAAVILTRRDHPNGSSRVGEAMEKLGLDAVIVLQGDEPLINAEEVKRATSMVDFDDFDFFNCVAPIQSVADLDDRAVVKAVLSEDGSQVIHCFRRTPFTMPDKYQSRYLVKIQGCFVVTNSALKRLCEPSADYLGQIESIEQNIMIYRGLMCGAIKLEKASLGINTPEEYATLLAGVSS